MVWRAGGFGGAGKGRTFFSVWFIAFLGPGGSPPGAALLGMARTVFTARVGPDCTSGWLRVGYPPGVEIPRRALLVTRGIYHDHQSGPFAPKKLVHLLVADSRTTHTEF